MKFPPELADSWFTSRPLWWICLSGRRRGRHGRGQGDPSDCANHEPLPREVYDRLYLADPWVLTHSLG